MRKRRSCRTLPEDRNRRYGKTLYYRTSLLPHNLRHCFERVVLDEAHEVRSSRDTEFEDTELEVVKGILPELDGVSDGEPEARENWEERSVLRAVSK